MGDGLGTFEWSAEDEALAECMNYYVPPIEREGLGVGDSIVIAGRWPCVVEGFNSLPDDVIVRWTGKRPDFSQARSTVCRKELAAMGYSIEKVESHE